MKTQFESLSQELKDKKEKMEKRDQTFRNVSQELLKAKQILEKLQYKLKECDQIYNTQEKVVEQKSSELEIVREQLREKIDQMLDKQNDNQIEDLEKNKSKQSNENKFTKKYFSWLLKVTITILLAVAMTYFDEQLLLLILNEILDNDFFQNMNPAPQWLEELQNININGMCWISKSLFFSIQMKFFFYLLNLCCSSSKNEEKIEKKIKNKMEEKFQEKIKELKEVIQSKDVENDQLKQSKQEFEKARDGLFFENEK